MSLHVDLRSRLRSIVFKALDGSAYEDSRSEEGQMLVLDARRPDGSIVHVRFRGVRDSESTALPERGAPLRVRGVGSAEGFSLAAILVPRVLRAPAAFAARISLDAGGARIDVVCQDVEWWEDPPAGSAAATP